MVLTLARRGVIQHALLTTGGARAAQSRSFTALPPVRSAVSAAKADSIKPVEKDLYGKPFYITTPIFYVNAVPHIGHLQSMIVADVIARWVQWRHAGWSPLPPPEQGAKRGPRSRQPYWSTNVVMATGTDEHGSKIQKAAAALGESPRSLCDRVSTRFRDLADAADVRYSRFIRTTDKDHIETVQKAWKQLMDDGFIYKGTHKGWYSVVDEAFYTDAQIEPSKEQKDAFVAKETGNPVEWTEEDNYKFRLSMFEGPIREWLTSDDARIVPAIRHRSTLIELDEGLQDLSISRPRSRLQWGIPVPDDDEQTMYVWFDALLNYLTVTGESRQIWPADVLVVGKDIIRFHAIYFPAFLLALRLPLPRQIVTHGHWTVENVKMSKSRGNVVDPFMALEACGHEEVRFFMTRIGGNLAKDVSWNNEDLIKFRKKNLQSSLGNYLSRVVSPAITNLLFHNNEDDTLTLKAPEVQDDEEKRQRDTLQSLADQVDSSMQRFELSVALTLILDALEATQKYWTNALSTGNTMTQGAPEQTQTIWRGAYYSIEVLRIAALLLQNVMPSKSATMLAALRIPANERTFDDARNLRSQITIHKSTQGLQPLFPQLSKEAREQLLAPIVSASKKTPKAATPTTKA